MDEPLDTKTKKQLQDLLRQLGLPVSGNKTELIERLRVKYCALAQDIEGGSVVATTTMISLMTTLNLSCKLPINIAKTGCRMKMLSTTSAITIYFFWVPCNVNKLNSLRTFTSVH